MSLRLWNRETNETFEIDSFEMRLKRQRRRVRAYCELLKYKNYDHIMITLTYKNEEEYEYKDITTFIRKLKTRYKNKIKGYTWVAEVQKRGYEAGGLHYHLIIAVPKGFRIGKPDSTGLWTKGMTKVEKARTIFYVVKYTGKEYQKRGLPKGYRLFAIWIAKDLLTDLDKWDLRKSSLPIWVVQIVDSRIEWCIDGVSVERCKGGGWWIDNMWFVSPYMVCIG